MDGYFVKTDDVEYSVEFSSWLVFILHNTKCLEAKNFSAFIYIYMLSQMFLIQIVIFCKMYSLLINKISKLAYTKLNMNEAIILINGY